MADEYVVCPFNKCHIISRLRFPYHLVKCKKNYPFNEKVVCPYDATHYVDPIDYTSHLYQCKRKKRLDVSEEFRLKQYESIQHGDVSPQTYLTPCNVVSDEWDVESREEDDLNRVLTKDEIKVLRIREETSYALKLACTYTPVVPPCSVGRGKIFDLYENYKSSLKETPESATSSNSVSYFPYFNGSCNQVENNTSEEEIYADAEEDNNDTRECRLSEKPIIESKLNDNLRTCDTLNNCKYFMGRGVNKCGAVVGRGATYFKKSPLATGQSSPPRILDNIINDVINSDDTLERNKMYVSSIETSITGNVANDSIFSDCEECSTPNVSNRSSNSPTVINKKDKQTPCISSDEMIRFPKRAQSTNAKNKLRSLLDGIVNDLSLVSLESPKNSEKCKTVKEDLLQMKEVNPVALGRGVNFRDYKDVSRTQETRPMLYLGRGHLLENHNLH